jgi:hypothetical protein
MGSAVPEPQSLSHEIDSEGFKLVADRLIEEAGVHPMLHRLFVAPVMDGDTIRGAIVESKAGRLFSPFLHKPFAQAIRDGVIPAHLTTIAGTWGAVHETGELTYMNLVHLAGCDGTDPDSLTRFEIEGRRQAMLAIDALRRYTPGCADARLRNFGMTIGIRDTRKIDAAYNLTEADVRGEARFEDSIGIYPEFIDGYGVLVLPTTGRYMHVPYRAMLPKGVKNLLVTGRAIGGDRIAHAATRNMACCAVAGQGAGIAAAVSLRTGHELYDVDLGLVHDELDRQGVRYR